jgi:hypothetical protein
MQSQSVIKQFIIFMSYLFLVFIILDFILQANWPLKIILISLFVLVIIKLFDSINHMIDIPTFRQQLADTNQTIKITCVFTFYSVGYFFVSFF